MKKYTKSIKIILYYFSILFSLSNSFLCYLGTYVSDAFYVKQQTVEKRSNATKRNYIELIVGICVCFILNASYEFNWFSYEFIYKDYWIIPTHWLFVYSALALYWRRKNHVSSKIHLLTQLKYLLFVCLPIIARNLFILFFSTSTSDKVIDSVYEIWSCIFVAAFVEELFFRGYLYELMKQVMNRKVAIATTSFTFVIWHTGLTKLVLVSLRVEAIENWLVVLFLGVITNIIYERTNSIFICIVYCFNFNSYSY